MPPGRPVKNPVPQPIPDTFENVIKAIVTTPPVPRGK